jgi:two-component system, cell cycle sensor histidine kinase and response regulator CckA
MEGVEMVDEDKAKEWKEREQEYKRLVDGMNDTAFVIDFDGRFIEMNRTAVEVLGYSREELLSMGPNDIDPLKDAEEIGRLIEGMKMGETQVFETQHTKKNGDRIPVEVSSSLVTYQGEPAILSIARDISERKKVERQLKLTQFGIDHAQLGVFQVDDDGSIYYANEQACESLGYTVEELQALKIWDVDPNLDLEKWKAHRERTRALGMSSIETTHRRKDGTEFPVEVAIDFIEFEDKKISISFSKDITERKKVEEQLRLTQFGIDHAQIGVFQVDDEGDIRYANEYVCKSLGYTAEEFLALKVWDVDPSLDQEMWQAHKGRRRTLGMSLRETVHRRKDGIELPVEVLIDFMDFENKRISFSFVKDITERKQAEAERELLLEQIREQAQQLREVMATVPEGVFLLDAEHRVVLANPVAKENLAVLADSKVGDTLTRLGDRPLAELLTPPPIEGLRHEVTTGGRTFEVVARPMANGHEPENWVLVIDDVTLERHVQEQLQQQERMAALGRLAAGIAHDFNNIMAVIVLYAQMSLGIPDLPSKLRERLQIISQQAGRATGLIQQILDFGRRAVLECRPMDLVALLEEQIELLRRTLPENIEISFAYEEGDYTVSADPTRMQQAVMNLALNARDAMATGGELSIYLARISVEDAKKAPLPEMNIGEWIRLTVTDTGVGILPDVFPHIFDPFFTTKAPGEGAGLGLAQVYGIVRQHGGHIDVATELGRGTSFILYLPALMVESAQVFKSETGVLSPGRGETILVVEDNKILQRALLDSIESLNYRVLTADTGQQALAVLEHADVALVVSDLVMPEMGGQALFHALRQRGLTLPVVMLSGHPMESELVSLQAEGLAGWLLKPPSIEQLAQLLAQALKRESDD